MPMDVNEISSIFIGVSVGHFLAGLLIMGIPDNKVHGANMGSTWVLSATDGPHVGPMNPAIRDVSAFVADYATISYTDNDHNIRRHFGIWYLNFSIRQQEHIFYFHPTKW